METPQRWWTPSTVAVVTGSNKGIGYHIARGLARSGVLTVMTSRNRELGEEAVAKLHAEGQPNVVYQHLDVTDMSSIESFAKWIEEAQQGVDILVNNAGIMFPSGVFGPEETKATLRTNYWGVRAVTNALLPLLRPSPAGARIVNVSSTLGSLSILSNALQERLLSPDLSLAQVDEMAEEFEAAVRKGDFRASGWPASMYGVSKVLLDAYTRVLAQELANRPQGHRIFVNSYCPGWCATDMGTAAAPRSPELGADTGIHLALMPIGDCTSGKKFKDKREASF